MAIVFAGANLVSPLWPVYRTELHLTAFALTVVFAAYAFGALCALFALGGLSDVIGRRPILLASVIGTLSHRSSLRNAQNIAWLMVARFVQGLAVGAISASANAALNDFAYSKNPRHASIVGSIATSVGFASGPFLAGCLPTSHRARRRRAFFVLIAFAFVALAALLQLPNSGRAPGAVYRGNTASVPAAIRGRSCARPLRSASAGWAARSSSSSDRRSSCSSWARRVTRSPERRCWYSSRHRAPDRCSCAGPARRRRYVSPTWRSAWACCSPRRRVSPFAPTFFCCGLAGRRGARHCVARRARAGERDSARRATRQRAQRILFMRLLAGNAAGSGYRLGGRRSRLYRALLYFALLIAAAAAVALVDLATWKDRKFAGT